MKPVDAIVAAALEEFRVPAASVAVVDAGAIVHQATYGASEGTTFNIASVSKQITCACILLLERDGKLSIDDPVKRWYPQCTQADTVTLRALLAHTAGYPDYYPLGYADAEKMRDTSPEEIVERYACGPLQFSPGEKWSYSNTGYHLLGRIVERESGLSYAEFVRERIARPLGMDRTFYHDPPVRAAGHAVGYTCFCMGPLREADAELRNWMYAAGGLASTAADIARWDIALLTDALLDRAAFERMTGEVVLNDGTGSGYALGWFVADRSGRRVISHSGQIAGFTSHNLVLPDRRFAAVVLSNTDQWAPSVLAERLLSAFHRELPPPRVGERPGDPDEAYAAWCVGQLREGELPSTNAAAEFAEYLTPARRSDARTGLRPLGTLQNVRVTDAGERGGMRWSRSRLRFSEREATAVLRRAGERVAEFAVTPAG